MEKYGLFFANFMTLSHFEISPIQPRLAEWDTLVFDVVKNILNFQCEGTTVSLI